jgi:hypothetical protein
MGRFTKGPGTTFPANWKQIMFDAGKQGRNNTDFFGALNIKHSTHFTLLRRNEEYRKAYEQYLIYHEQHWLDKAKVVLEQGGENNFNAAMFLLLMGNKQRKRWKKRE